MNETSIKQLGKLSKLMQDPCSNCHIINKDEGEYRCCDRIFCGITERGFKSLGVHYENTGNEEVPFMGEDGCIIPPKHRPFCTMFACPGVLESSRKLRREYKRLEGKLKVSDYVQKTIETRFLKGLSLEKNKK